MHSIPAPRHAHPRRPWNSPQGVSGSVIAVMAALVLLKQLLISAIPLLPFAKETFDDGWVLDGAISMRNGEWMGPYDAWTLVKGPFSPWLVSWLSRLGLSFMTTNSLLYGAACIATAVAFAPLIRATPSRFILFLVLLGNPVSYAAWTYQRLYRNGITLWQTLFVISCLSALFLRPKDRLLNRFGWALIAGLNLAAMWNNREDAIWIIPFVLVATAVLAIQAAWPLLATLRTRTTEHRSTWRTQLPAAAAAVAIALTPLLCLKVTNSEIRHVNNEIYGVSCTTEINDCHFAQFMKSIYSVKWDTTGLPPRNDVPLAKLEYLYTLSPTLNSISEALTASYKAWAHEKGYVENGMLIWPIRDGVQAGGYYKNSNAAATDAFYAQVAMEIDEAIATGRAQAQPTMPSALMPPWHRSYAANLPRTIATLNAFVLRFDTVSTAASGGSGDPKIMGQFIGMSGDRAIVPGDGEASSTAQAYTQAIVIRVNRIAPLYGAVTPALSGAALVAWLLLATSAFRERRDTRDHGRIVFLTLGIAGSYLAIVGGVSYNELASVKSTYYMYLSAAYPLAILFTALVLLHFAETLVVSAADPTSVIGRYLDKARARLAATWSNRKPSWLPSSGGCAK